MRIAQALLLVFLSVSALFGGWHLITDPTGQSLNMPLSWLAHSPFTTYFAPGIILFVVLGLGSALNLVLVVRNSIFAPLGVVLQGLATVLWIVTELVMVQGFHLLQLLYLIVGMVMFALAWNSPPPRGSGKHLQFR